MDVLKDFFPSHFIKAHDLNQDMPLTIKAVRAESFGFPKRRSCCVYFHETDLALGLNKTNATTLVQLHGPETNDWTGKAISIFPTTCNFQGKQTPCIRIRDVAPSVANTPPNTQPTQPATEPAPDALPETTNSPLPDNLRKRLHAVGTECYGDDWDDKRPTLVAAASTKFRGQAITSSNDLTEQEALYLIQGMERKLASLPAENGWSAQTKTDMLKRLDFASNLDEIRAIEQDWQPLANRMDSDDSNAVADAINAAEERVKEVV